jgi:nitrite reductase/ring-hydroxylating ferredoxin subunit
MALSFKQLYKRVKFFVWYAKFDTVHQYELSTKEPLVSEEWQFAARAEDIEPGEAVVISLGGREIALFRVGDEFFATDNRCTHAAAPLADGYFDGEVIECPLHQGLFNVRTGAALCSPALKPLKTYSVRIADGQVQVRLC